MTTSPISQRVILRIDLGSGSSPSGFGISYGAKSILFLRIITVTKTAMKNSILMIIVAVFIGDLFFVGI